MASINQVTICNKALSYLGEPAILSIDDDTVAGRKCKQNYDTALDHVTSLHTLRFARKRVILAPDVTTPAFGFDNQFELPSDFVRHFLITDSANVPLGDYKIEGNKILSALNPIYLIYIARMTPAMLNTADPTFAEAVSLYMASVMAVGLTQNLTLAEQMVTLFERALSRARGIDSKNDQPQQLHANEFIEARTNGSFDFDVFRFTTP